jgi:hypothetical protein
VSSGFKPPGLNFSPHLFQPPVFWPLVRGRPWVRLAKGDPVSVANWGLGRVRHLCQFCSKLRHEAGNGGHSRGQPCIPPRRSPTRLHLLLADDLEARDPALAQLAAAAVSGLPPAGPELRRKPLTIALPHLLPYMVSSPPHPAGPEGVYFSYGPRLHALRLKSITSSANGRSRASSTELLVEDWNRAGRVPGRE